VEEVVREYALPVAHDWAEELQIRDCDEGKLEDSIAYVE
jgi:hypothetical protein